MAKLYGGWSIDKALFDFITKNLPKDSSLLELGSGRVTKKFAEIYTVHSIEHDKKWVGKYNSHYIHAPLKKHKAITKFKGEEWYDPGVLRKELPKIKYDAILIDGPPGENRSGVIKYWNLFDSKVMWILDDVHRKVEQRMLISLSKRLERPYTVFNAWGEGKMFGVIYEASSSKFS